MNIFQVRCVEYFMKKVLKYDVKLVVKFDNQLVTANFFKHESEVLMVADTSNNRFIYKDACSEFSDIGNDFTSFLNSRIGWPKWTNDPFESFIKVIAYVNENIEPVESNENIIYDLSINRDTLDFYFVSSNCDFDIVSFKVNTKL
ncbi:hypothetical protein Hs30E_19540 [Lactococcus hodotermopsidis]|uniref:Uncharacterized protein n=1 Tax=Pseudolactococcus hodotermopsidis TaxID=2709157 RepID=A0A6A0BFC4_9LACT|nr:hypothetical protein Hs30E_19540 [Lactococcus hodotermopsidis]